MIELMRRGLALIAATALLLAPASAPAQRRPPLTVFAAASLITGALRPASGRVVLDAAS